MSKDSLMDRITFCVSTHTSLRCRSCQRMLISTSGWPSASPAVLLQEALHVFLTAKAVLMAAYANNKVGLNSPILPET